MKKIQRTVVALFIFFVGAVLLSPTAFAIELQPSRVFINEIFTNPVRGSGDTRWIELYNDSSAVVDISSWRVTLDGCATQTVGKVLPIGTSIEPKSFFVYDVSTGCTMSNQDGKTLRLMTNTASKGGVEVAVLQYGAVLDQQTFGLQKDGNAATAQVLDRVTKGTTNSPIAETTTIDTITPPEDVVDEVDTSTPEDTASGGGDTIGTVDTTQNSEPESGTTTPTTDTNNTNLDPEVPNAGVATAEPSPPASEQPDNPVAVALEEVYSTPLVASPAINISSTEPVPTNLLPARVAPGIATMVPSKATVSAPITASSRITAVSTPTVRAQSVATKSTTEDDNNELAVAPQALLFEMNQGEGEKSEEPTSPATKPSFNPWWIAIAAVFFAAFGIISQYKKTKLSR